ncbi:hypothetical protein BCR32DRAFT_289228 [Anaeromyces robustus]|uniref:Cilia- and flagella-associated protein 61 N-terminal domain-containing protein n=1 Tax=Anaeromyces robustus TaxID=1754192 RepID=A0A1Y1XP98_9FUNG|nr:hypothetical protein BCR32DRAFT_289228 [Anaeromyces robustus]|eukprot:ORX87573.1 hypothetical protein BCR32DRAFT_289228 [Anaeromyces robustus]
MVLTVRRASADDVDEIYNFIREDDYSFNKLKLKYGTSNISYLIDTSAISIVGIDKENQKIIGFISVSLSPYKEYIKTKDWTKELPYAFELKNCSPYNTMFLSCCVYKQKYSIDFLFYSLKQIFLTIPNLKYIGYLLPKSQNIDKHLCYTVPPRSYNGTNYIYDNDNEGINDDVDGVIRNSNSNRNSNNNISNVNKIYLEETSNRSSNSAIQSMSSAKQRFFFNKCRRKMEISDDDNTDNTQTNTNNDNNNENNDNDNDDNDNKKDVSYLNNFNFWVCFRKDLVYLMKIRKARVEDCDDLIPMFKQKSLLDDPDSIYYFSELLENKDEHINTIVAELNNKIVGFMSMRNSIEYSALLDKFDLDLYETLFDDITEVDIDEELLKDFSSTNISNKSKIDSQSSFGQNKKINNNNNNNNNSNSEDDQIKVKEVSIDNMEPFSKSYSQSVEKITDQNKSTTNIIDDNNNNKEQQQEPIDELKSVVNINNSGENIKDDQGSIIISSDNLPSTELETNKKEEGKENEEEFKDDYSESIESINDLKKVAYLNNVLCINLFYIDDYYASYSNEFLKSAFNLYPDKEYCLISLPTMELSIPLLDNMTKVEFRENINIRHSLYICHRESSLNQIKVRKGLDTDIDGIEKLIENIPKYIDIIHQAKMALLSMNSETDIKDKSVLYVAECLDMVVGFAILKSCDNPNVLIEQFNIEKYCTKENHHFDSNDEFILSYLVMNPLYENKARYFLEEIMRQTELYCLIHTFNESMDASTHKILLKEFVPVKRRRQIQFVDNKRDMNKVADHLNYNISLITTNLLYEPKITINTRIVVIGASDTGISFLETLIYKSHYLFNNLILVSENDSYGSKKCPYAVDNMNYSVHDLEKMNIENYVQYINSVVNVINREEKNIVTETGEVIEYDYLIITTGLQFHPEILDKKFSELKGVYSGSNIESCIEIIDSFSNEINEDKSFVVYGNDIQAFPILKALMDCVPLEQIYFIIPNYDKNVRHWFDNRPLEKKVLSLIHNYGVNVLINYQLIGFDEQISKLSDITISNVENDGNEEITIKNVEAFFYVDKKSTNNSIFNAINNSFLVFDGNLIIGSHFQTNDDYIFSAGSLTRYTSKYETLWNHSYYNSKECGKKLAKTLLPIFEGNEKAIKDIKKENEALISFNDLVATRCILPGDLMFFHFDKPYLFNQTKAFRKTDENYGRDLIIHNNKEFEKSEKKVIEYFHIHIDTYGFIQSLTYVGKEDLFSENMICLYGMHEKYLNRLISRFDEGIIPDFKKFLNEPWAQPLFHDRFRSYMKRLRTDLMNPSPSSVPLLPLGNDNDEPSTSDSTEKPMEMKDILDKLYNYIAKNEIVPEEERIKLYDSFDKSIDRKKIDHTVYRYLVESGFYNFP